MTLDTLAKTEKFDMMWNHFQRMRAEGSADTYSFNTVLNAMALKGDVERVTADGFSCVC
jgi:hypothetical protein